MPKIDKTKYTKDQIKVMLQERRIAKQHLSNRQSTIAKLDNNKSDNVINYDTAFVLGNGTSRKSIDHTQLKIHGPIYGCNALYREFEPDFLIAVDVKMILEINEAGFQHKHKVWTNPNKAYKSIENLNFFKPSKGWSSGPTALWLASRHNYNRIFILGFDYKGLNEGRSVNNIYVDTKNYKKSTDGATYYGNWLKQTSQVIRDNPNTTFIRVISSDNFVPPELNKFSNVKHISVEDFQKIFNIS